jgi:hypothetical protein
LNLPGRNDSRRDGDRDRGDRGDRDRNTNVNDRSRDRNVGDRDRDGRDSNRWKDTWYGDKGDRRDDRDWSGRWRDSNRYSVADQIRRDWNNNRNNNRLFSSNWWGGGYRGNSWSFWGNYAGRYNRPWYWWSGATGPRLSSWIAYGWPSPYYWDYGRGEYIYYDNGGIFVNGRLFQQAPVYYDRTVRLIEDAPDLTAETAANLEWMPLGVFAVTPDGEADANIVLQLAVTKDGVIGGTAFDQKGGAAFNIQGIVDKQTQRAVWSFRNDQDKRVVMETSIYNLTQPEATGMVQYGPNDMRVIELVRLQQPDANSATNATLPTP